MTNKTKTLVKIDDEIFEVKNSLQGLRAKKLSEDDSFEISVLDEGIDKFIENDLNKLANEAYKELRENFKNTLQENVLKVVGFDNRYGNKWEVDHCNGRQSAITVYMSNKVQQMFSEEFDKLLQPEIKSMMPKLKTAIVKEFEDSFRHYVRSHVRVEAEKAAKSVLSEVMTNKIEKIQKQMNEKAEKAFLGRLTTEEETDSND